MDLCSPIKDKTNCTNPGIILVGQTIRNGGNLNTQYPLSERRLKEGERECSSNSRLELEGSLNFTPPFNEVVARLCSRASLKARHELRGSVG